jgi:transglutaminase-like putative cysteine protease
MAASAVSPPLRSPLPSVERFFQFSLLGMLASGFFAVASSGYLDWPTQAAVLLALVLRGAKVLGWMNFELPQRAIWVLLIAYLGFFPIDLEYLSGSLPVASLHLLVFLVVLKLLTAKTDRDYGYLRTVAALGLLAAAMLSVNMSFLAFLALFLLFTSASLASGEVRRSASLRRTPARAGSRGLQRRLALLSTVMFLGILALTAGMFFVLPRTARSMLGRFAPQHYLTGFGNEVRLGDLGEIKRSGRAVMHVRSAGGSGLMQVRWRGASLSHFDGHRWFSPSGPEIKLPVEHGVANVANMPQRPGHGISYVVQLEEIAADTLFFAGTPERISVKLPEIRVSPGGSFRVTRLPNGIVYGAYSFLEDETAPAKPAPLPLMGATREEALQLPVLDPRIPDLARAMTADAHTDAEKARALEQRLRHDYGYTLELLTSTVADPLANFLFVRRKGHCEYFASSMAVMLRSLGIPSRVVTGFQSGVFNPITGLQVVRASDAHSWVEAWIIGSGWTTFDPTPVDPRSASTGITSRIELFFDAADQFWQDWVVSYDLERQVVLASRMEESGRKLNFAWLPDFSQWWTRTASVGLRAAGAGMGAIVLAILAVLYGPALARWLSRWRGVRRARRGEGEASDATLLYERMLTVLARRGFQKPPWLTPLEFARVLPNSEMAVVVEDLTTAYNAFRFGGRRDVARQMIRLLERLETVER